MKRRAGNLLMAAGAVCILAALALFLWNQWEAGQAAKASAQLLKKVKRRLEEESVSDGDRNVEIGNDDTERGEKAESVQAMEIDGYQIMGYLSIASLNLELPVFAEWDYKRLRSAPCRYTGSVETENLVIAGHNYERHFGGLSGLSAGEEVVFVGADGMRTIYEVERVDVLKSTSVEEMTAGEYDLTLFTCTYGGKSRLAVRCESL